MRMTTLIIILLIAGISLPVGAQAAEPPTEQKQKITIPYPLPELYFGKKNGTQLYLKAALEFVQKNPKSPFLSRIFMDIYMTAIYNDNVNLAKKIQTNLLMNAPHNLYGSFLLSTFKSPQQLHDFIAPYVNSNSVKLKKAYCNQLYLLIKSAIHMQGWDFLKNPSFMVKCGALLQRAAPEDLKVAYHDQAKEFLKTDAIELQILNICFNHEMPPMDKIAALDAQFSDDQTARFVRMVYMVDLDSTDLQSARLLEISSKQYLQQGNFELAEQEIQKLLQQDNQSQYRFWLGWAQAAQTQTDTAMATLKQVYSAPWRGAAQRFERQLKNLPENLLQHSQIIQAMVNDIATNLDGLEMTIKGVLPDDTPFDLYIGIGTNQDVYLILKENGRVQVAYHSDKDKCEIYFEKHARRFSSQGPIPTPLFNIVKNTNTQKFSFQFAISIKPYASLEPALKKCVESEYLTTDQGLSELIVGMIRKGSFPATVGQNAQGIELKWLSPTLDDTQLNPRIFTVDSIGKLLAVSGSNLSITQIKYGPRDQMVLSAPQMPRANYIQATDADDAFRVTAYNRILKSLMSAMK